MLSRRWGLSIAIMLTFELALSASKIDLYKARIESLIDREEAKIRDEKRQKQSILELKKERTLREKSSERERQKFVQTKPKRLNKEDSPEYARYERQLALEEQKRLANEKKFAAEQKRLLRYQKKVEAWVDPIEYDVKPTKRKTQSTENGSNESAETIHYDSGSLDSSEVGF